MKNTKELLKFVGELLSRPEEWEEKGNLYSYYDSLTHNSGLKIEFSDGKADGIKYNLRYVDLYYVNFLDKYLFNLKFNLLVKKINKQKKEKKIQLIENQSKEILKQLLAN